MEFLAEFAFGFVVGACVCLFAFKREMKKAVPGTLKVCSNCNHCNVVDSDVTED